jgi:pyruvate kinase
MKRTKIICTIGPACDKSATLLKLAKAGMNVARLNFSHNTHEYHLSVMKKIRATAKKVKKPIAIVQDLQGPRIRLGDFSGSVRLVDGGKVVLTVGAQEKGTIPVAYARMNRDVKSGERVMIADGAIELIVSKIVGKKIYCVVKKGGIVTAHKGINLPDTKVCLSALTGKDKDDLLLGVKNGVEFVALSFVRSPKDVESLKILINQLAKKLNVKNLPKVIVKIERREAMENIDKIISAADAVMVARGDLGIELSTEDVPLAQKMIIEKCLRQAKPVIVATQMLESMIENPRPTRAEASDVANAVIDHADALMLSGETANGRFPVEAVTEMAGIIKKIEDSKYDDLNIREALKKTVTEQKALGGLARVLAENVGAKALLVVGGESLTRSVVSLRPELPVIIACAKEYSQRQAVLNWGAIPFVATSAESLLKIAKKNKLIKNKNKIVVVDEKNVYVKIA